MDRRQFAEVKRLLRLLGDEPAPEPMAERLVEMYREWCRENGIRLSSDRQESATGVSCLLAIPLRR